MKVLAAILVLAAATSAFGQSGSRSYGDKAYWDSRARGFLQEFIQLNAQVPTLSPAEERWLEREIDDTEKDAGGVTTSRSVAARSSREYQLRVAKPHIQQIIRILNQIPAIEDVSEVQQAVLWTQLATLFLEQDFWQAIDHLVRRTIVKGEINGLDGLYYENHSLWA